MHHFFRSNPKHTDPSLPRSAKDAAITASSQPSPLNRSFANSTTAITTFPSSTLQNGLGHSTTALIKRTFLQSGNSSTTTAAPTTLISGSLPNGGLPTVKPTAKITGTAGFGSIVSGNEDKIKIPTSYQYRMKGNPNTNGSFDNRGVAPENGILDGQTGNVRAKAGSACFNGGIFDDLKVPYADENVNYVVQHPSPKTNGLLNNGKDHNTIGRSGNNFSKENYYVNFSTIKERSTNPTNWEYYSSPKQTHTSSAGNDYSTQQFNNTSLNQNALKNYSGKCNNFSTHQSLDNSNGQPDPDYDSPISSEHNFSSLNTSSSSGDAEGVYESILSPASPNESDNFNQSAPPAYHEALSNENILPPSKTPDSNFKYSPSRVPTSLPLVNGDSSSLFHSNTDLDFLNSKDAISIPRPINGTIEGYVNGLQVTGSKPSKTQRMMFGSWYMAPSMLSPIMDVSPTIEMYESRDNIGGSGIRRRSSNNRSFKSVTELNRTPSKPMNCGGLDSSPDSVPEANPLSTGSSSEHSSDPPAIAESGFGGMKRSPAMFLDKRDWEKYAQVTLKRDGLGQQFGTTGKRKQKRNSWSHPENEKDIIQKDSTAPQPLPDRSPPKETQSASVTPVATSPNSHSCRHILPTSIPCSPSAAASPDVPRRHQMNKVAPLYGSESSIYQYFKGSNSSAGRLNGRVPLILSHILLKEELKEALKLQRTKLQDFEIEAEERDGKIRELIRAEIKQQDSRKASYPLCALAGSGRNPQYDSNQWRSVPDINISFNCSVDFGANTNCSNAKESLFGSGMTPAKGAELESKATQTTPVSDAPKVPQSTVKKHRSSGQISSERYVSSFPTSADISIKGNSRRPPNWQTSATTDNVEIEQKNVATNTHLTCRSTVISDRRHSSSTLINHNRHKSDSSAGRRSNRSREDKRTNEPIIDNSPNRLYVGEDGYVKRHSAEDITSTRKFYRSQQYQNFTTQKFTTSQFPATERKKRHVRSNERLCQHFGGGVVGINTNLSQVHPVMVNHSQPDLGGRAGKYYHYPLTAGNPRTQPFSIPRDTNTTSDSFTNSAKGGYNGTNPLFHCPRFLKHHRSVSTNPECRSGGENGGCEGGRGGNCWGSSSSLYSTQSLGTLSNCSSPRSSVSNADSARLHRKANSDFACGAQQHGTVDVCEESATFYSQKNKYTNRSLTTWKI